MFVLDSHCDTPSQIYRLRDIGKEDAHAQVDFPKLQRGGVDASFFAAYIPSSLAPDAATRYALELIACTKDAVAANSDVAAIATTAEDAFRNKAAGKVSVFLERFSDSEKFRTAEIVFRVGRQIYNPYALTRQ